MNPGVVSNIIQVGGVTENKKKYAFNSFDNKEYVCGLVYQNILDKQQWMYYRKKKN